MRDVAACASAVAQAAETLGGLDILVNNAGYEEIRPSLDVDEALWDRIVSTNLKGAFFCAQAAARQMMENGKGGSIINLCSLTSYVGVPTAVPVDSVSNRSSYPPDSNVTSSAARTASVARPTTTRCESSPAPSA